MESSAADIHDAIALLCKGKGFDDDRLATCTALLNVLGGPQTPPDMLRERFVAAINAIGGATAEVLGDSLRLTERAWFEIELIKQVEINVDYILMLVAKWREARGNGSDKEMSALMDIQRSVDSSPALRNKKDLVLDFVDRVTASGQIDEEWRAYIQAQRTAELEAIIADENLKPVETKAFIDHAFRDGSIPTTGTAVTKILPPASRFSGGGGHGEKKARVLDRLGEFFDRFFGLGAGSAD